MPEQYYLRFRGQVSGPHSPAELRDMARRNVISGVHEVSGDQATWTPLRESGLLGDERPGIALAADDLGLDAPPPPDMDLVPEDQPGPGAAPGPTAAAHSAAPGVAGRPRRTEPADPMALLPREQARPWFERLGVALAWGGAVLVGLCVALPHARRDGGLTAWPGMLLRPDEPAAALGLTLCAAGGVWLIAAAHRTASGGRGAGSVLAGAVGGLGVAVAATGGGLALGPATLAMLLAGGLGGFWVGRVLDPGREPMVSARAVAARERAARLALVAGLALSALAAATPGPGETGVVTAVLGRSLAATAPLLLAGTGLAGRLTGSLRAAARRSAALTAATLAVGGAAGVVMVAAALGGDNPPAAGRFALAQAVRLTALAWVFAAAIGYGVLGWDERAAGSN